jgi:phospholipid/cholesterol/gamma-HCH transport system permease protein
MVLEFINYIGAHFLELSNALGAFALFVTTTIKTGFTTKFKVSKLFVQMERIGVESFSIIVLTGTFAGMAFALQSYIGFQNIGGEQFIGTVVARGMIRELGPVLTGLMVTGRAGSAITAEIGTMSITEQIDALKTLRINIFQYLMVPRILGATIILPFLGVFCMFFGVLGGYIVAVHVLELSPEDYITGIRNHIEVSEIRDGLIKTTAFGFILSSIACYKGYTTSGGARGVGISTTKSVVLSSIMILIANYFLTKMLEQM